MCIRDRAVERYPEMVAYGSYAKQLEPCFERYGRARVLPVFFDRLTAQPQAELERVCRFLGYAGTPLWRSEIAPSNVSSQRLRRFPFFDTLVASELATRVRRGMVPRRVRDWVKARLTMKDRPSLSPEVRAQLEVTFNRDLAILGDWLGTELDCANFRQVTATNVLEWKTDHE